MADKIWKLGTQNYLSTTLSGNITADSTEITVVSSTGFQAPGILVVDRINANNENTPVYREYISFTGITDNTFTGCVRGLAGSTGQAHANGAKIEEVWSVTHWNDMVDVFDNSIDSSGFLSTFSTASLADLRLYRSINASGASSAVDSVLIQRKIDVSGGNVYGLFGNLNIEWHIHGTLSMASVGIGKPIPMIDNGTWQFFTATTRTPASGATLMIDINNQGTSIFDSGTRLMIPMNGTFASTASIATRTFTPGNVFTVDIDNADCITSDLTVVGRAT